MGYKNFSGPNSSEFGIYPGCLVLETEHEGFTNIPFLDLSISVEARRVKITHIFRKKKTAIYPNQVCHRWGKGKNFCFEYKLF